MTCSMEIELGAYVLDALEPGEAAAVRGHLDACARCREEARSLASTASVLSVLTREDLEQIEARPPQRHVPGQSRVALATAAVVLAGVAAVGAARMHDDEAPGPAVVAAVDPGTHVHATVTMSSRSWGTALHLRLASAPPAGWCSLVARSRDGRTETAAYWLADADGAADIEGATDIPASDLSGFEVRTDTGRLLVRIPAPHRT